MKRLDCVTNFFILLSLSCSSWSMMGSEKVLKEGTYQKVTWPVDAINTTFELRMPGAVPSHDDSYLHSGFLLPDRKFYIVGFTALASADVVHHMLIYGCSSIGKSSIWEGTPCLEGSHIIFAWAKNAPPFDMPKDVGTVVGEGSATKYIVVQIHYVSKAKAGEPADTSGIKIFATLTPPRYQAGILLLATGGHIPPHTSRFHVDASCRFKGKTNIYPFAARVHAHTLARVISGYLYNGSWHMIAKGNPQWPQAFYPTQPNLVIKPRDHVYARCTYNSSERDRDTYMGATNNDEMCNLYTMYYTDLANGSAWGKCGWDNRRDLLKSLPAGNDVPLPPNPVLDSMAHGHHHHHSHGSFEETPRKSSPSLGPDKTKP